VRETLHCYAYEVFTTANLSTVIVGVVHENLLDEDGSVFQAFCSLSVTLSFEQSNTNIFERQGAAVAALGEVLVLP
jgi:hypothetical protein